MDEDLRRDSFGLTQASMVRPPVVIDRERLAAALRARKVKRPTPPAIDRASLPVAMSREECRRCGIPGFKGCDHQQPYVEYVSPVQRVKERDNMRKSG